MNVDISFFFFFLLDVGWRMGDKERMKEDDTRNFKMNGV